MAKRNYIAFDVGAESGRCIVGTLSDGRLEFAEVHRFPSVSIEVGGDLFWDILAIFAELRVGLARAVDQFGPRFNGVSVDTWAVDYVLLDAGGRLLGYPYHYRSPRTIGMMEDVFSHVSADRIYEATGIQFMPINTLYRLRAGQQRSAGLLEFADRLLLIPDYLHFLLCGSAQAEYTNVSTTQLADPVRRDWAWELIDELGFPRHLFPEVVPPGARLGRLWEEMAAEAGMADPPPVFAAATHDTAAAVAGIPAVGEDWAFLSSGSWSLMGVELEAPLITARTRAGNFTNEGGVSGRTRLLKNISGLWLLQESRRHWETDGLRLGYDELTAMAADEGRSESWIDPDDERFLAPGDMPGRIAAFLTETGQVYRADPGWITRCILESLAFKYRQVFREIEDVIGRRIERLHVVGGGVQNRLLCRLTAGAVDREVVAGPVEGTALGNIGMQAVADGAIADLAELRRIIRRSFPPEIHRPENTSYWDEHEDAFASIVARRGDNSSAAAIIRKKKHSKS